MGDDGERGEEEGTPYDLKNSEFHHNCQHFGVILNSYVKRLIVATSYG